MLLLAAALVAVACKDHPSPGPSPKRRGEEEKRFVSPSPLRGGGGGEGWSFAAVLLAPPTVALPAEVKASPGRLVKLTAETTGTHVRWALASDDADLIPFPDGKTALFCSAKAGRFLVLAWTAAAGEPSEAARCWVVVGDPKPEPDPKPADPLAAEFRKLLAEDPSADKVAHLIQLAAVYREAVAFAERAEVGTVADLAGRIRAAAASLLPADALVPVRKRIADEVAKQLPVDDRPLDASTRKLAAKVFARIANALDAAR